MEYLDYKVFVLRQEVSVVGGYFANEKIECLLYIHFNLESAPDGLFLEILEFQLALIVLFSEILFSSPMMMTLHLQCSEK